jgi:hypothetical protein
LALAARPRSWIGAAASFVDPGGSTIGMLQLKRENAG